MNEVLNSPELMLIGGIVLVIVLGVIIGPDGD